MALSLLTEDNALRLAIAPQSLATATNLDSQFIPAKDFIEAVGIGIIAGLTTATTFSIQLLQATDAYGNGKKVLGTATTYTAGASDIDAVIAKNVLCDTVDAGYEYIGMRLRHTSGASEVVCGLLVGGKQKVAPVTQVEELLVVTTTTTTVAPTTTTTAAPTTTTTAGATTTTTTAAPTTTTTGGT